MKTMSCKDIHRGRRAFTFWMAGALATRALPAMAQPPVRPPIADMHSHYTMFLKRGAFVDLRKEMEETGATLIAWAIVDDTRWTQRRPQGIFQVGTPGPGELWDLFRAKVSHYDAQLKGWNLPKALTPADVDAALAGKPH